MEKSALDWFASEIKGGKLITNQKFKELFDKGKEMEKQHIIDAYCEGNNVGLLHNIPMYAIDYYNETFKSE